MKKILALVFALILTLALVAVSFADAPAADTTAPIEAEAVESEAEASDEAVIGIDFTLERLPANLGRMGVGMLCILIVMGILIAVTMVLNRVTAKKK